MIGRLGKLPKHGGANVKVNPDRENSSEMGSVRTAPPSNSRKVCRPSGVILFDGQPFMPPCVRPPTTRSWKSAMMIEIGTMATTSAAEMIGQGNENSP